MFDGIHLIILYYYSNHKMFSAEKSKREESIERSKYSSGAQLLLGAALFACAVVAVVEAGDYYINYYVSGFVCGVLGFVAGALGVYVFQKAADLNGDDLVQFRNQIGCKLVTLKILDFVVIMASLSGIMMCIIFLTVVRDSGDNDDESDDDELKTHTILAACILAGLVLLDCAILFTLQSLDPCCINNQGLQRTYPNTGATTVTYQNSTAPTIGLQPVFSTRGFGAQQNAMYPVSQNQTGGYAPPHPLPYGFQPQVLAPQQPTGPPPAYPY